MTTPAFVYMMNQTATYWAPGVNDGMGGVTLADPVAITCRWTDKVDLVRSTEGQEVASSAMVHCDRQLEPKGWLVLGDVTDESDPSNPRDFDALQIINTARIPSLDATQELHKAWL